MKGRLVGDTIWSDANRRRFATWAWVPEGRGPFPLLVLLHGVYDAGGFVWWTKGKACETLDRLDLPVVVVMAGDTGAEQGSGYCDWADGTTYAETHIVNEVLPWAEVTLPVGPARHIAGLSMGGYGSLLLALRNPGLFASASSTRGFFDPTRLFKFVPDARERMWGGSSDEWDPRLLVQDPARRADLRLALDCGVDDELIDQNREMHELLGSLGIEHGYAEHPGGHEWDYWAARLEDHVRFALDAGGPLQP